MTHIFNPDRFHQKADFGNMLIAGTDVDFFAEIRDRLYLMVEWKCAGAGLPPGQRLAFKRLVSDLGQVKPTFHVVAYHDTQPTETIHGENSMVASVMYRIPNMASGQEYIYDSGDLPTLNQWLGDFSYEWRLQQVLRARPVPMWEGIPRIQHEDWDGTTQTDGPSAFFDDIRPVRHAFEFG